MDTEYQVEQPSSVDVLQSAQQAFDKWRINNRSTHKFPKYLWELAAAATCQYGINRVAKELGLSHSHLKRHINEANQPQTTPSSAPQFNFVEALVSPGALMSILPSQAPCVIELTNARGATMRVQLHNDALVAGLTTLYQAFWSA
jgi:DNA-binding phage protein